MLAGLAGPEDVEENDDFTDIVSPSARCEPRDGLLGCVLDIGEVACVDDAEPKGEAPWEAGLLNLVLSVDGRGLNLSLPGCGLYAMGGGCTTAAMM